MKTIENMYKTILKHIPTAVLSDGCIRKVFCLKNSITLGEDDESALSILTYTHPPFAMKKENDFEKITAVVEQMDAQALINELTEVLSLDANKGDNITIRYSDYSMYIIIFESGQY